MASVDTLEVDPSFPMEWVEVRERPRRKVVSHAADRYPLTGQRVEIGGAVGTIVEYLSENIALLRHDLPPTLPAATEGCGDETDETDVGGSGDSPLSVGTSKPDLTGVEQQFQQPAQPSQPLQNSQKTAPSAAAKTSTKAKKAGSGIGKPRLEKLSLEAVDCCADGIAPQLVVALLRPSAASLQGDFLSLLAVAAVHQ